MRPDGGGERLEESRKLQRIARFRVRQAGSANFFPAVHLRTRPWLDVKAQNDIRIVDNLAAN